MKPIILKDIALRFVETYYPRWVSRFDRIWDSLLKTELDIKHPNESLFPRQLKEGLGFAAETDIDSRKCISGIVICAFTYKDLKNDDEISEEELNNRVRLSPLGLNDLDLQTKLENVLCEMLPSIFRNAAVSQKKEPSTFTTDFKIKIKLGPKHNGLLIINKKEIAISPIEYNFIEIMINQLREDWFGTDKVDAGWVSHEYFMKNVGKWSESVKQDQMISDSMIANVVYRINQKIRKTLKFTEKSEDLIVNGKQFGWSGHYRLRIHPDYISYE